MATPKQFRARWELNMALAESCGAKFPEAKDWEIVFRFYAIVHLVEGFMRTKATRFWSESHEQRRKRIKESPELKAALAAYFNLDDLSRQVRYEPDYVPPAEIFATAKDWAKKVQSVVEPKLIRATEPATTP